MTSREKILIAATTVFARKGRHGARMEEIAAEAAINKAMIYYIFTSKDELYFEVIKYIFLHIFSELRTKHSENMKSGKSPQNLLIEQIEQLFDAFSRNIEYTKILIDAVSNGENEIPRAVTFCKETYGEESVSIGKEIIIKGIEDGEFRTVDPDQLEMSIHGMIFIFFMSRSMCDVLDVKIGDEKTFLKKRKECIIDLILHGVLAK